MNEPIQMIKSLILFEMISRQKPKRKKHKLLSLINFDSNHECEYVNGKLVTYYRRNVWKLSIKFNDGQCRVIGPTVFTVKKAHSII